MRRLIAVLSILALAVLSLSACATLGKIQPLDVACKACVMLQASGVCTGLTATAAPKCEVGKQQYIVNYVDFLRKGAPPKIKCR